MSEIDLTRFGEVKRKAFEAYGDPKARITTISIEKPVTRPGGPLVLWKIGFGRYAGDRGAVLFDAKANVVDVELAVDRQGEAGPSISGSGMAKFMDRLAHDFGKDALFADHRRWRWPRQRAGRGCAGARHHGALRCRPR